MFRGEPLKIWYKHFDESGNEIGRGVYHKEYKTYGHACNMAKKMYGSKSQTPKTFEWAVCSRDPWINYYKEETCDICGKTFTIPESPNGITRPDHIIARKYNDESRIDWDVSKRYVTCPDCMSSVINHISSLSK